MHMTKFLPVELGDYISYGIVEKYESATLHHLLDGDAEVYRAYNVSDLVSRRYMCADGGPDINVYLMRMQTSAGAFGAYHHDIREGVDIGVGQESEFLSGCLYFWKGRYFVSILVLEETPEAKTAVIELGRRIADNIEQTGAVPEVMQGLPGPGLVRNEIYFFFDWQSLNRRYFLADDDLLELGNAAQGVLARYDDPDGLLVLVRYPEVVSAERGMKKFMHNYIPDADPMGYAQMEDGGWTAVIQRGVYWAGVFEIATRRQAESLIDRVRHELDT